MLYAGDEPVAGHFGLAYGGVLAHWFPAYDPRYSKYSPGLLQLLEMTKDAPGLGIRSIDLGKGEARYKQDMKSYDLTVAEGTAIGRPLLGNVLRVFGKLRPAGWRGRSGGTGGCSGRGRSDAEALRADEDGAGKSRVRSRVRGGAVVILDVMRAWVVHEPGPMSTGPLQADRRRPVPEPEFGRVADPGAAVRRLPYRPAPGRRRPGTQAARRHTRP